MESHDIKTNLTIGKNIFENIPVDIQPGWSGLVLSRFDHHVNSIPSSVKALHQIIDDQTRWKEAHAQFNRIRKFNLANPNYVSNCYLRLSEQVAKVTYNASGEPAPFDMDSGWYIPSIALKLAAGFEDDVLEEEVKSTVLIFNRNKKMRKYPGSAKDFLLYKKIDDILWFDWDPLGINGFAPRDEYQSYIPQILRLKIADAPLQQIADLLFKLEKDVISMGKGLVHCYQVAEKIKNIT